MILAVKRWPRWVRRAPWVAGDWAGGVARPRSPGWSFDAGPAVRRNVAVEPDSLVESFVAALPRRVRVDAARLAPALEEALSRVRREHPGADGRAVVAALARVVSSEGDLADAVRALFAEDVWLARSAAEGDHDALELLDRRVHTAARSALARMRPDSSLVDEVAQRLRTKLLVADGSAPKLLDYAGRGALSRWLEAAALRIALNLKASDRGDRQTGDAGLERLAAQGGNPDAALMRGRYGPELKRALEEVLAALPVRERNLLRLYFVQGLTVEEIGRLEGTHKSTVSRWISKLRVAVLEQLRERLAGRLGLNPAEVDSLVAEVRSQLHLSVSRVLGPRA
jgi:RNA polymerase sigma-70 factor (ECF subfamily)